MRVKVERATDGTITLVGVAGGRFMERQACKVRVNVDKLDTFGTDGGRAEIEIVDQGTSDATTKALLAQTLTIAAHEALTAEHAAAERIRMDKLMAEGGPR